jgi:hypothetical protein
MKKSFLTFFLVVLAFLLQAQIPGFSIGPKIGYNSNRLTTDLDSITADPNGSFNIGAFVRIGKKVYIQPEVNYVIKGGELVIGGLGRQKINLSSISIPVLVGVRPVNTGMFNLRFMAGPTFTYVSNKTLKPLEVIQSWPIKSTDDLKDAFWSFQMGGGFDLFFLTIDLRYELGVDNIYAGDSDFSLRNNLFNVSLGFKLL